MKVQEFTNAIEILTKYADKEAFFRNNGLYMEINSPDVRFSFYTRKDESICTTLYLSDAIYYKFFTNRQGLLLVERGCAPDLTVRFGLTYILNLLNKTSTNIVELGKTAIDAGNYRFRNTNQDVGQSRYRDRERKNTVH